MSIEKFNTFMDSCTEEQQQIIHAYIDNNYNTIQCYREYNLALDGCYALEELRMFVKILENLEHCRFLEQFDKEFPINERYNYI